MGKRTAKDLTGRKFGALRVLGKAINQGQWDVQYLCRCVCGREMAVTRHALLKGTRRDCGCKHRKAPPPPKKKPEKKPDPVRMEICEQGYINLVNAIVNRARLDMMQNKENTPLYQEAKRFFLSDWFLELTGADGASAVKHIEKEKQKRNAQRTERKIYNNGY